MRYPTLWKAGPLASELFSGDLFDRFFNGSVFEQNTGGLYPAVDVRETRDEVQVIAELPGISPDDVSVTVENGVLTISGEKRQEADNADDETSYRIFERRYGKFARSFTLPRTVNSDKIQARYENGVLHIALPKSEAAKPKKIPVKVGK